MKCPFCGNTDTQVIDSRVSEPGGSIRRRRRCTACTKRFTTYETVELRLPQVVKTNGTRSDFDVMKVRNGFQRALHKRPVPTEFVDQAVDRVIARVLALGEREIPSRQVGEMVMQELYVAGQGCLHPFRIRLSQLPGRVRLPRRAEGSRGAGQARAQVVRRAGRQHPPMTAFSDADRAHMARALELAERGLYTTTPNPRVGCVIVHDGEVIGEGWHGAPARRTRRSTRSSMRRRGDTIRAAHALHDARALQPHRPHAACTEAVIAAGDRPCRRRDGRSERRGGRRRGAAARGRCRRRHRSPRRRGARAQHRLRLARDARPPVGADEGRGEPRRPHGARPPANRNGSPARSRAPTATAGVRAPARS